MGKQRSRQLQDGRGTSNYQYKKEGVLRYVKLQSRYCRLI